MEANKPMENNPTFGLTLPRPTNVKRKNMKENNKPIIMTGIMTVIMLAANPSFLPDSSDIAQHPFAVRIGGLGIKLFAPKTIA